MSRKRILHIVESTTAGVRRYVTNLVQCLPLGWDVDVACPAIRETHFGDIDFVSEMTRLDVPVHLLSLRRSISLADVGAARSLYALVKCERFDLLHTHSSKAGFIGRLVAKATGIPAIHTPNGLYFLEQSGVKRWFYVTLERLVGRVTNVTIAVSEGERDVLLRHKLVLRERVIVIENGVDVAAVRSYAEGQDVDQFRHRITSLGRGPIIGGIGRLVVQKDPFSFVRAAQRIRHAIPDSRFIWVGDGELTRDVERLAQQLDVPLLLIGHSENVWALLSQFDVFVLPSLYEGLPFSLLEAMALGVPVIATDVVGTKDVLQNNSAGRLVPPRDDVALAQAVLYTLAHPDVTQSRVEAAYRLVKTRFSLERMCAAHHELYINTIRDSTRHSIVS